MDIHQEEPEDVIATDSSESIEGIPPALLTLSALSGS